MQQRVTRVSCSPQQIALTFDNGDTLSGQRNRHVDIIASDILRLYFSDDQKSEDQNLPEAEEVLDA